MALTSWGTKDNPNMSFFVRWILKPLFIGHILADMERMEEYIEKTDLNYTIVRPPGLSNSMYTLSLCFCIERIFCEKVIRYRQCETRVITREIIFLLTKCGFFDLCRAK